MDTAITTERISIPVAGEPAESPMGAFLACPAAPGRYPSVLLFMEIFGINNHIRDVAQRIARQGYVVLAPDYFHRTGPGIELNYDQQGMERGMPLLMKLKRSELIRDIDASLGYLRSRSDTTDRVGAMGFCIGGHVTYLAATQFDLRAAASFYGGGIASTGIPLSQPDPTVTLTAGIAEHGVRILCLFGGQDTMIPQEQVQTIEKALKAAGARHEVVVYPDANHGFFCDQRGTFNEAARDDAWQRVLRLFAEELQSPAKQA